MNCMIHGECTDCQGCATLECRECMFFDELTGCDPYIRNDYKCIFKYKGE